MSNRTLRELAKDYARGEIDKDDYRKSRVELITAITAGEVNVKAIDFPPPLMPSGEEAAITETAKRDKTEIFSTPSKKRPTTNSSPSNQQPSSERKKTPLMFIAISAVIVISLIIVVILFYPKPPGSATIETSNASNKAQATAPTTPTTTSTNMAGESLIADFLTQHNWTEENLDNFIKSWSALSQEERDSAKPSKRMQRMHDSIYKQFLEEKALSSIDSEKAALKQEKLIEFAKAIGMDDSRLILE